LSDRFSAALSTGVFFLARFVVSIFSSGLFFSCTFTAFCEPEAETEGVRFVFKVVVLAAF
jgi:hypothetical protein